MTSNLPKRGVGLPSESQELLLTAALGDADVALPAWNQWREQHELNDLDNDSRRLLPLIGYNFNQTGIKIPDAATISSLTRLGLVRNKLLFKSLGEVARLLGQHNIDVLFIKGVPVAIRDYPYPALRPMSDGDILIRAAQFNRAIEIFKEAGWMYASDDIPSEVHHAVPMKNTSHQELDVHRFALGECPYSKGDETLWRSAVTVPFEGITIQVPNPTDLLFLTCVNSVHSPLRWVLDAMILIRGNEIDWPRLIKHARHRKLALVTRSALNYIVEKYAAPIPPQVLKTLHSIPVSWLEKHEYESWEATDSQLARLLLRYAAYRRVQGSQHPIGFLNHLRRHGNLNSYHEIPLWLLRAATQRSHKSAE
ncbi:hypothetical protein EON83_16170 [bacterium]|nr:MAG: hypothetical protein EON83_16170 [bacterium]